MVLKVKIHESRKKAIIRSFEKSDKFTKVEEKFIATLYLKLEFKAEFFLELPLEIDIKKNQFIFKVSELKIVIISLLLFVGIVSAFYLAENLSPNMMAIPISTCIIVFIGFRMKTSNALRNFVKMVLKVHQ